ncbi:RxLR effector protein [Phytophthora megakarya]|uniref:RxLR effector protein n=1 Tax=Phytophthora megakarya TaxID=4795 RepID=A0A225VKU3_9STRA|nr:RxLR effector protein [Phytophthora megakarya]
MLEAGKIGKTKKMSTKLQNAQFKMWYEEGKLPYMVIQDLFKLTRDAWYHTAARPVWFANKMLLKNNKLKFD